MITAIYPTILMITTLIISSGCVFTILFYYNNYKQMTKLSKYTKLTYNQLVKLIKEREINAFYGSINGNNLDPDMLEIENIGILLSFKDWIHWNYTYRRMKKKQKKQKKQDNYIENYFK